MLRRWVDAGTDGLEPELRIVVRRLNAVIGIGIAVSFALIGMWAAIGAWPLLGVSASYVVFTGLLRLLTLRAPARARSAESLLIATGYVHLGVGALISGNERSPLAPFLVALPVMSAYVEDLRRVVTWIAVATTTIALLFLAPAVMPMEPVVEAPRLVQACGWVLALFTVGVVSLEARRSADALRGELAEARDEALASADARTRFLARMSHEIRTPLHGSLGMTEVLLSTDMPPHQRELVDGIRQSGSVLLGIVDQVLDLSKLDADRLELAAAPYDPVGVVEEVLGLYAVNAALVNTVVVAVVAPDCPGLVVGDGARVRQVVGNLVNNAVKFTREGVVCVRMTHQDGALRVAVEDTGIGLTEEELGKLFRPYRQANRETSLRYGGTGLGLSVAQRLARRMGGDLTAASEAGRGSTFELTLPAAVAAPVGAAQLAGVSMVVIDGRDAPSSAVTAASLLGMDVWRSGVDGARAPVRVDWIAIAWSEPGLERICAEARERWPDARVLLLASMARPSLRSHAHQLGFDASVFEPVRRDALLDALQGRSALDEPGPAAPRVPEPSGRRVLVVDDNPVNRRVAEMMLVRFGADVRTVDSGEEALDLLDAGARFDLVVMDVLMPGMSGIEAMRALRAMDIPQPRVVALSASVLEEQRAACIEAGADAFLRKPLTLEALEAVLRDGGPRGTSREGV